MSAAPELRFEQIALRDLERFAARRGASGLRALPPRRARAQARNPYARPSDRIVHAAYSGRTCVGYSVRVPGLLWNRGKLRRILWGSTVFVAPEQRRTMLGLRLVMSGPSDLPMFCTGVTESLAAVLRVAARPLRPTAYLEASRPSRGWTPPPASLAPRWRVASALTARDLEGRYRRSAVAFYRGPEAVNWMLRHPWIEERRGAPSGDAYEFSAARPLFRYRALRLEGGGAAVFLAAARGARVVLRLLDWRCEPARRPELLAAAWQLAGECEADAVEMSAALAPALARTPFSRVDVLERERPNFLLPARDGSVPPGLDRLEPDYCDGDTAFT